jgi:hypothetical protein
MAAQRLDLEFEQVHSGYGLLEIGLKEQLGRVDESQKHVRLLA